VHLPGATGNAADEIARSAVAVPHLIRCSIWAAAGGPRDDLTTSCGNHRPPGCEPSPESETLSYDGPDGFPQRGNRGTEGVRQHGEND
jgi:hypothetical protein